MELDELTRSRVTRSIDWANQVPLQAKDFKSFQDRQESGLTAREYSQ